MELVLVEEEMSESLIEVEVEQQAVDDVEVQLQLKVKTKITLLLSSCIFLGLNLAKAMK